MKKSIFILSSLFLTIIMQGQIIPQPKSGPIPTIKIGKPEAFRLKNGLKVIVVENHKLPRVSYRLTLDNTPTFEGNKKGVSDLLSAMVGNGTTKISKNDYNEEIDFLGASVNINAHGAAASSLSKFSTRVLELMSEGALNPLFTQEEFDKQKAKALEVLKSKEKDVSFVAERVGSFLPFGSNHPFGEFVSEQSINNITLEDVKNYYKENFVPENAYLIIVGDVTLKEIKKNVEKQFEKWGISKAPSAVYPDPKNVATTQINFIDMPNAVQSQIAVINLVNLKMTDPDYFAAIVANQILGGGFNSYINMNLREAHGWTYGANSSISGDRYISKFEISTQVRNMVTDSAVVEIFKEFKKIKTEKVSDEILNGVKASYIGQFVMQIEKPQTIADYALKMQTQGLPANFYENYIKNINAVTPDDVLRAANKYFLIDNIRIIIVGKGSDVLPGLEKLNIPMNYFDTYGNPVAKTAAKKEIPTGVTIKTILNNYIKAIGGEKAVASVKTIAMSGSATVPQAPSPLSFTSKADVKGQALTEISMGTMSMMKQVVNLKEAYIIQRGQRKDLEGAELTEMRANATPIEELNLINDQNLTLNGIESINNHDAYVIKNGKTSYYYDVVSGLKLAKAKTIEQGGQTMNITTNFEDYKEVKGVKIPFTIIQNMGFELNIKMSDIKINEGVTDKDFQ